MFDWKLDPHRRYNPLTGEWVLVSPQRTAGRGRAGGDRRRRGRAGLRSQVLSLPGNERAGGVRNPNYTSTFVFDNDFAALKPTTPVDRFDEDGLLIAESEPGICRVVCFLPRHNLTIAGMDPADLRKVVDVWVEQYVEIGANPAINYVQIFENRGAMMGASNPHPHCQIWSSHALPNEVAKNRRRRGHGATSAATASLRVSETRGGRASPRGGRERHFPGGGSVLGRLAVRDGGHLQTAPALHRPALGCRARWPGGHPEAHHGPLRPPVPRSFPYSMGIHQRPTDGFEHEEWHLHLHFYPPLLRSATVRKFLVGYEMLATRSATLRLRRRRSGCGKSEVTSHRIRELADGSHIVAVLEDLFHYVETQTAVTFELGLIETIGRRWTGAGTSGSPPRRSAHPGLIAGERRFDVNQGSILHPVAVHRAVHDPAHGAMLRSRGDLLGDGNAVGDSIGMPRSMRICAWRCPHRRSGRRRPGIHPPR